MSKANWDRSRNPYAFRDFGSKYARNPSPIKFKANTVKLKTKHGAMISVGYEFNCTRALLIKPPQLGVGIWTPMPKKLSVLSAKIVPARSIIETASKIPEICGNRCFITR